MTFWQIWGLAAAIKLLLLPWLPLTADEAYYFTWARHLSLSYFDHPPFIAWIMWLAQVFWKTPLTIRLPGVILGHMALVPWYFILKRLKFSERASKFWLMAVLLGPLTGLGGFIITPDVPLLLFWSLALLAALRLSEKNNLERWVVLGAVVGFGLLSKYSMVLFFPAWLIWTLWEKKTSWLKGVGPWLAVATSMIVFLPVIIWNSQNQWASFLFQIHHGLGSETFHFQWLLNYLGSQFGLINPFICLAALFYLVKNNTKEKFLISFSFPLLFFFISTFRGQGEANWPVCAYPCVAALAARALDKASLKKIGELLFKAGIAVSTFFLVVVISQIVHPWFKVKNADERISEIHSMLQDVQVLKDFKPLYARTYQLASFYSYYRNPEDEVFKIAGLNRRDFYDFLPDSQIKIENGQKAYAVLRDNDAVLVDTNSRFAFSKKMTMPSGVNLYEIVLKVK